MGNINVIIPDGLHKKFRMKAAKEEKLIKEAVVEALEEYVRRR